MITLLCLEASLSEPPSTLEHPFTTRSTTAQLHSTPSLSLDPLSFLNPTPGLDSIRECGISIPELTSTTSIQNHDLTSVGGEP